MSFFEALRNTANSVKEKLAEKPSPKLTRDERFRLEYRLPSTEFILDDTSAELSMLSPYSKFNSKSSSPRDKSIESTYVYSGRLFLTPHFLVFRDSFDHTSCVMVLNISTIKRVERANISSYAFSLQITLLSGARLIIQFIGLRYRSEEFSHKLKVQLRENIPQTKHMPEFLGTLYSEYLIEKNVDKKHELKPPSLGLGQIYKYPGDSALQKEKAKLRLWFEYFKENGMNLSLIKHPAFYKLIRVGIPNRLRGEVWELCSGSMYERYINKDLYQKLLDEHKGENSRAIEEIEKDLNRSLPDYAAYQEPEGIDKLRNVLVAYSWKNPDVGYCQAMNIVVAVLLIFMSEEQAFWSLCNLCDLYVPGYYSKTMYGTLLDQRVFESFVESKMPVMWNHIVKYDIQLSVVSLPWFLSLFFIAMPLPFAFRIMDIFFVSGPKTLFQVALAVLKVNADDLLEVDDDGMFIAILKSYFQRLDDSAHPDSSDVKYRQITKFQELLVVAFKEFDIIDDELVETERNKYKKGILHNIESFAKRTQLRNVSKPIHLTPDEVSNIYDVYYQSIDSYRISMGTGSSNMVFSSFVPFVAKICDWGKPSSNDLDQRFRKQRNDFLKRLFNSWDKDKVGELTMNDIVSGLDKMKTDDIMESMNNFFQLYDEEDSGKIQREKMLEMSEDLLFLTEPWKSGRCIDLLTQRSIENDIAENIVRKTGGRAANLEEIELPKGVVIDDEKYRLEQSERYLHAASSFLQRCFEYAQPLEQEVTIDLLDLSDETDLDEEKKNDTEKKWNSLRANAALNPNAPCVLDLATFRMLVLADETYEQFFANTLRNSIHVDEQVAELESRPKALRNVFDGLLADGRRVANQVRRRVDSVATQQSATSNQEKQIDLDDFTTDHGEESLELLHSDYNDLMDMDEEMHSDHKKLNSFDLSERTDSKNLPERKDLIEFEA
ncbi:unnamed protein product [Kluyveromyces dobzhanskii CBS 2104]|uniref:WGS project CCBQ000000000 data, contig 00102 n=1 Tax=Kluyveromyces dobzhanskii CBS 2104 TaxID=1427455 RepID=A0A0A8L4F1_9SACH|nr:unnamed protein product [Kluyveromyces dobzhanskii CBS 2104]